jgi:hypothetical protein
MAKRDAEKTKEKEGDNKWVQKMKFL